MGRTALLTMHVCLPTLHPLICRSSCTWWQTPLRSGTSSPQVSKRLGKGALPCTSHARLITHALRPRPFVAPNLSTEAQCWYASIKHTCVFSPHAPAGAFSNGPDQPSVQLALRHAMVEGFGSSAFASAVLTLIGLLRSMLRQKARENWFFCLLNCVLQVGALSCGGGCGMAWVRGRAGKAGLMGYDRGRLTATSHGLAEPHSLEHNFSPTCAHSPSSRCASSSPSLQPSQRPSRARASTAPRSTSSGC